MISRARSMVGLDVGRHSIKAIELTHRGKGLEVTGFGQVEVPADDHAARVQAIKDLMSECGFKNRRVVTNISGKQVIVRYLSMVRMSDEELKNAIQFEAEKYVPFPIDDCVLDCQRMGHGGSGGPSANMTVLLVAVKRSQVEECLELLREAALTPEVIDVDAFAVGNARALTLSGKEDDTSVIAFVDVGASKTNINIMRGSVSLFSREIAIGGQDFTEAIGKMLNLSFAEAEVLKREPGDSGKAVREAAYATMDDLGNEIQLSFDYFENQFDKEIESIRFSGGGSRFDGFIGNMEKMFEKPTDLFNPFEQLRVNQGVDKDLLSVNAPQLVVAVGLAARLKKD